MRRPVNPVCPRLEAQLATIDRGGTNDPAKDEQIRRYQDAAAKQQAELDRVTSQAKRMGCDSSGFFSLFNNHSAQCGPVNTQIQQMRANLDQITTSLERLRGGGFGGPEHDNQRRSVLTALAQNNCGPQYANAARAGSGPGNFLNNLFGGSNNNPSRASRRRYGPAVGHLSHGLRPQLRRRLFPDLVRHRADAFSRRREELQGALPGDGSRRSTPIAIPARTSTRRSRSTASLTPRCRTRSDSAPSSIRPAPAGRRARPGRTR